MKLSEIDIIDYNLTSTLEIISTSECGDKLKPLDNAQFESKSTDGPSIVIDPNKKKQEILGIGSSFTESAAYVLAHLSETKRKEVMRNLFSDEGANYSFARTHIGSCDFCVEGKYSYCDSFVDTELSNFSLKPDKDGFSTSEHPFIKNDSYDLLPMIKEALDIKSSQQENDLRIIASAWTAPPWMKDINDWYISGYGGVLNDEHKGLYADYLVKYIKSYAIEGIPIWGITPINEPEGNNGSWESMHFTAESQRQFIKDHLGPKIKTLKNHNVSLLFYDHNRNHFEEWADTIYSDKECTQYVAGGAVHWYETTHRVFEDVLENVHRKYPHFLIINSEACIDAISLNTNKDTSDQSDDYRNEWFDNDEFWWNKNATDWAYGLKKDCLIESDHVKYTPVHRYAKNIIVSLNHWMNGWIDWNCVLDESGGPNHVGNYCGSPIMINLKSQHIYYTPIYYILSQFSRTIRPGDIALGTVNRTDGIEPNAIFASSSINPDGIISVQVLNTTKTDISYNLDIGTQTANLNIKKNSLQTIKINLPNV